MNSNVFEIIRLVLQLVLAIFAVFVYPKLKTYLVENTTKEQRQNAIFWTRYITKIAEDLYNAKGSGIDKKKYVFKWLNDNNVKLSDDQLSVLIDMVVAEYNKNGWGDI